MASRNPLAAGARLGHVAPLVPGGARVRRAICPRRPHARAAGAIARRGLLPRAAQVSARGARRTSRSSSGSPRTDSGGPRAGARRWSVSHFAAWVDFLHFATRPPEDAARLVEGVIGLLDASSKGGCEGKGVLLLTAHLGNWEVGGLMLAQVKQPIHVVLVPGHLPGRRAASGGGCTSAAASSRSASTAASCRRSSVLRALVAERHRRHAGRPRLRQHGRRGAVLRARGVLPARPAARRDGLGRDRPAGLHRADARRPLPRHRRGAARRSRPAGDRDAALRTNLERYVAILERYVAAVPGAVVLLLSVLGRSLAEDEPSRSRRSNGWPRRRLFGARRPPPRRTRRSASRAPRRRAGSPAARSPPPRSARRQFSGVRKPWLGRVAGSVATPVKFSRKLKTNST